MIKSWSALLSLILCLSWFTVHAQDGRLPAPVSVTIDSYKSIQELPQPKWMIKEGSIHLSIEDILNGDIKDGSIVKIHQDEIIIDQFERYWFAIEFVSEVDLQNWLLHVENPFTGFGFNNNFSKIKSYAIQEGKLVYTGNTGFFVPASERDYHSRHAQSLLNLNLSSGRSMTLWIHISKNNTITSSFPNLTIHDPAVSLPAYFNEKLDFLFFGGFLIVWILSLTMFLNLKDETSFWFFVFMTTCIIQNLTSWSSDPLTSVLYPENPKYGFYIGVLPSFFNVTLLLQFSRVFVNLPLKHKKLDKIMIWATLVLLFSSLILFYGTNYFENLAFNNAFFFIYGLIYLASGTTYLFLKDPLSKIMGVALLVFIIPQLISVPIPHVPITGLLVTVTIGVGYRIMLLFKERLQAEREKKDLLTQQNTLLENQVADRTAELSHSLTELKATQSQLVQQEKLASLGQLTAGIAHEIKNPLNFVNNFSGVSLELIDEALEEIEKGQEERDEILIKENMVDIKSNLQKVHEHGTRANSIVSSMLQHSRGSSGKMEPTDLNALIKEYVNLSFHGMRAGKNPIDVDIALDLDPQITDVPIIKKDFTRVVINLCNNAFDAMREKFLKTEDRIPMTIGRKTEDSDPGNIKYDPKLKVTTSLENGQVRISFEDNGPGIPDEIKDKILQPFFTTKKGTEGTGLGLSITNDIIKAHGGELEIETTVNKGTAFIITLNK